MSLGLAFWILMLVWFVFWLVSQGGYAGPYGAVGHSVLGFVLFALLGWQVFGPPLHG